jgi:hypothetical protein
MRVYWRQEGIHIHMRVFIAGAKMGALCCRVDEFETVKAAMLGFIFTEARMNVVHRPEDEEGDADRETNERIKP